MQSGAIKIYYGWDDNIEMASVAVLERGDKFHVPIRLKHRMVALEDTELFEFSTCLLYTSPSPRDRQKSRMPSSA